MRYVMVLCVLALAIAFDLGGLITPSADVFRALDPDRSATCLPLTSDRLHASPFCLRRLVTNFADAVTVADDARIRHDAVAESQAQEL